MRILPNYLFDFSTLYFTRMGWYGRIIDVFDKLSLSPMASVCERGQKKTGMVVVWYSATVIHQIGERVRKREKYFCNIFGIWMMTCRWWCCEKERWRVKDGDWLMSYLLQITKHTMYILWISWRKPTYLREWLFSLHLIHVLM